MTSTATESFSSAPAAVAPGAARALPVLQPPPANRWLSAQYALVYFFLGVVLVWILSGWYKVGHGEVALVQRLGQYLTGPDGKPELMEAGLHYHLPWPVDRVYIVPLSRAALLPITDFNTSPASYEQRRKQLMRAGKPRQVVDAIYNPYLITGDQNILHAQIAVQYEISHPFAYLTSVYQPPNLAPGAGRLNVLRLLTDHQLIRKMAAANVEEALYSGHQKLESEIFSVTRPHRGLQAPIDALGLGVQIQSVSLKSVRWPKAVDQAFSAVLNARQREDREIQDAKKTANTLTTLATGEAEAVVRKAKAAARRRVNEAQGESQAFSQIYAQYRVNPRVITLKLLSDALGGVMRHVDRVFFVQPGQQILLSLPPPKKKIVVPTAP